MLCAFSHHTGCPQGGDTVSHHPWQGPTVLSLRPAHPSCPKVMFSLKRRLSSRSSCVMWHHFSLQGTSPFGTTVPPPNPLHPPLHVTKDTGTPPGPLAAGARPVLDGLRCARLHPTC